MLRQRVISIALCVLAAVVLVEWLADVTILGDFQSPIVGVLLLLWLAPEARSSPGFDRTLARIGVVAALLLIVGGIGDLIS